MLKHLKDNSYLSHSHRITNSFPWIKKCAVFNFRHLGAIKTGFNLMIVDFNICRKHAYNTRLYQIFQHG